MLEEAKSDVLILLDCCAAASSATGNGKGITEIIAACGFEAGAPGVGEHSFTRSLIDELKYLSRAGLFSSSLLHNKVLSRVKYWKPRYAKAENQHERRRTPIYIVVSNVSRPRSIELQPLQQRYSRDVQEQVISSKSTSRGTTFSSLSIAGDSSSASETASETSNSSVSEVWPDRAYDHPKVIISIALEEEQFLIPQHLADWIRSVPALVRFANVEGIYKSHSTMVLIAIPVAIWNLVPSNPAISFVGFSKSKNLLKLHPIKHSLATPEANHDLSTNSSRSAIVETMKVVTTGLTNDPLWDSVSRNADSEDCIAILQDPEVSRFFEAFVGEVLGWMESYYSAHTVSLENLSVNSKLSLVQY